MERRDSTVDTPFVVMAIDNNGDGTIDDELNFGPWYQTGRFILPGGVPDQGSSQLNTWQKWDALRGGWFAFTTVQEDPDHSGHVITMAAYKTKYPNAVIRNLANGLGGFRIQAGGPIFSNNFIGYVDKLKIGVSGTNTTYDFEE
ncbi:hypothetical protein ACFQT0_09870 [Hymenobacter humi]|uniref:Uncharacterized protein n=1 Tax=Hymenobacter humi TaxID=1411620 RepID=A0ABW2U3Q5_9BACT